MGERHPTRVGARNPARRPAVDGAALTQAALDHLPHGLCMFDADRRLILCNAAYARMYGLPTRLTRRGTPLDAILAHRRASANAPADMESYFDVVPIAHRQNRHAGTRVRLEDGRTVQITHNPMPDGGYVAVHEDVTSHVEMEDRLRHLAAHDSLTGLYNRHAFAERLDATLAEARPGRALAIYCLDLDRFKAVNDRLGHHVGDLLLRAVASRLTRCAAARDVVARLGGDEFVVLQPDVGGPERTEAFAGRIAVEVAKLFDLNGHAVSVGASVGVAVYPLHGSSSDELLKSADRAMYRAKTKGGRALRRPSPDGRAGPPRIAGDGAAGQL